MPPRTPHSHAVIFQLSPQINLLIPQKCFAGRNDSLLSVHECVLEGKVRGAGGSPSQAGQRARARERTLMVQPDPGQGGKASGVPSFAIPGILCHPCGILKELVLILVFLTLFATATKKPHFKIFFK